MNVAAEGHSRRDQLVAGIGDAGSCDSFRKISLDTDARVSPVNAVCSIPIGAIELAASSLVPCRIPKVSSAPPDAAQIFGSLLFPIVPSATGTSQEV